MIKDRGNIKWTAMMLPEHVAMLRELQQNKDYQSKPIIDDQRLEELNQLIYDYLQINVTVVVTYYSKGTYDTLKGIIKDMDPFEKELRIIVEDTQHVQRIKVCKIVDIVQG